MGTKENLESVRDRLAVLQHDVDNIIMELYPPVIPVPLGANFKAMVMENAPYTVFNFADSFEQVVGVHNFDKPFKCLANPFFPAKLIGEITFSAPDISLTAVNLYGNTPGTILSLPVTAKRTNLNQLTIYGQDFNQHRGIQANFEGGRFTDINVLNISKVGQETQAIAGWSGTKDLKLKNCVLEAAGIPFMFGGGNSVSEFLIPQDIVAEDCTFTKKLAWKARPDLVCKGLFEVKNGKNIRISRGKFKYAWKDDQTGYPFVFTVRNPSGLEPWSTIDGITVEDSIIEYVGAGTQIDGIDVPSRPTAGVRNIIMRNNRWSNVDPEAQKGADGGWAAGRLYQITNGPKFITLDGEEYGQCKNINYAFGFTFPTVEGLVVRNSKFYEGHYGIHGSAFPIGKPCLDGYAPGYVWENITMYRNPPKNIQYPVGTTIVNV